MTRRIQIFALVALTSVAAIWGASFVLMKDALQGHLNTASYLHYACIMYL